MVRIRNGLICLALGFLYFYVAWHYSFARPNAYNVEGRRFLGKPGSFSLFHPRDVFEWDFYIFKSSLPTRFIGNGFREDALTGYFWGTIGVPSLLFFISAVFASANTRRANSKLPKREKLRGIDREDNPKEFYKLARKIPNSDRGILIHQKVALPRSAEAEGIAILGGTGSGKTKSCVNLIVKEAFERGDKVIVLDSKGDFTSAFLGKEGVHLIAPWDTRSVQWDLASDMPRGLMDADMIGNAVLPPIPNDHQPIFRNASFNIFTGALNSLYQDKKLSWASLFETISDIEKLKAALSAYPSGLQGYTAINGTLEDALKFLSSLHNNTKWLYYLGKAWPEPSFSLRSWMRDGKGGMLVLRFASDYPEFRPMCAMVLSILIAELLSWPVDKDTPVWFVLDEIANIKTKIGNLAEAITAGRERGGRVVLASQDVSRLFDIYGQDEGRSILNSLRTFVSFWAGDKTNSEYAADCLGAKQEQRLQTFSDGKSSKTNHLFDGSVTHSESVSLHTSQLVLPSELAALNKGEAFIRVPGLPISKLQWSMTTFENMNEHESLAAWVQEPEKRIEKKAIEPKSTELKNDSEPQQDDDLNRL